MLNSKINLLSWTSLSAFTVANCLLYSWAFWNDFDINILQFTTLNDLLPAILFSIALPIITIIAISIMQHIYNMFAKKLIMKIMRKYKTPDIIQLATNHADKVSYFFAIFGFVCPLIILLFIKPDTQKFVLLWVPITAIFFLMLNRTEIIPSTFKKYRIFILLIVSVLPASSYSLGYVQAYKIKHGIDTYIVKSDSPCLAGNYRYIGSTSTKAFAMSLEDKNICIFNYNYLKLKEEKHAVLYSPLASKSL